MWRTHGWPPANAVLSSGMVRICVQTAAVVWSRMPSGPHLVACHPEALDDGVTPCAWTRPCVCYGWRWASNGPTPSVRFGRWTRFAKSSKELAGCSEESSVGLLNRCREGVSSLQVHSASRCVVDLSVLGLKLVEAEVGQFKPLSMCSQADSILEESSAVAGVLKASQGVAVLLLTENNARESLWSGWR